MFQGRDIKINQVNSLIRGQNIDILQYLSCRCSLSDVIVRNRLRCVELVNVSHLLCLFAVDVNHCRWIDMISHSLNTFVHIIRFFHSNL